MLEIGTQTQNVVYDDCPAEGFDRLKAAGFDCVDFSLNTYLINTQIYKLVINDFFRQSVAELQAYFRSHKEAAATAGIRIHQLHMPYPVYVPHGTQEINAFLRQEVAPKSLSICAYLGAKYIVVHGFKLRKMLGSEEAEWAETENFLESICPLARELGLTICIENIYESSGGGCIIEGPCCDASLAAERIDRLNEKYGAEVLGFCFDTGHANLLGLDFARFIRTLGPRLKVLHIHDNDGRGDLHQLPFTFTRTRENRTSTDWAGFIQGLQAIGFRGVLSFETAPVLRSYPEELKDAALRMIAATGRYFGERIEGEAGI